MKKEDRLIQILREMVSGDVYDNHGKGTLAFEARKLLKEHDGISNDKSDGKKS